MVQGGYVSPSNDKKLTVNKKTNVLNKIPPRGPKGNSTNNSNSTNNNNNNSPIDTPSIDVSVTTKHPRENLFFKINYNFLSNSFMKCYFRRRLN